MTEVFKQIIVLLTEEDMPFDVIKKGGLWCIQSELWDIIDFLATDATASERRMIMLLNYCPNCGAKMDG